MDKNKKPAAAKKDLKKGVAASKLKEDNKSNKKAPLLNSESKAQINQSSSKASPSKSIATKSPAKPSSAKSSAKEISKPQINQAKPVKKAETKKNEIKKSVASQSESKSSSTKNTTKIAEPIIKKTDQKAKPPSKITLPKTKEKPIEVSKKISKPDVAGKSSKDQAKDISSPPSSLKGKDTKKELAVKETYKKTKDQEKKLEKKVEPKIKTEQAVKEVKAVETKVDKKIKEVKFKKNKDNNLNQSVALPSESLESSFDPEANDSLETKIPKKRGRKPKPKVEGAEMKILKKRGRKKNEPSAREEGLEGGIEDDSDDTLSLDDDLDDLLSPVVAKRRPGRPPKVRTAADMMTFKLPSPSARIMKREPLKPKKPLSTSLPGTSLAGLWVSASNSSNISPEDKTKSNSLGSSSGNSQNHSSLNIVHKIASAGAANTIVKDEDDNSRPSWALRDWVTRKGERLIIKSNELVKEEQFDILSAESSYGVVSQSEVDDVIRRIRESYKKKVNPKKPNSAPEI